MLARPAALLISLGHRAFLAGTHHRSLLWPKGFASVIYGFLLLNANVPDAEYLFHLLTIVIAISMIAHSSADVLLARWFAGTKQDNRSERFHQ